MSDAQRVGQYDAPNQWSVLLYQLDEGQSLCFLPSLCLVAMPSCKFLILAAELPRDRRQQCAS